MSRVRPFVPALLLLMGSAMIAGVRPRVAVQPAAPLHTLSVDVEGYSPENGVLGDEERRVAGVSDYLMRLYRRDSVPAPSVYVGYYERQARGQTIHSPKNCLPGAGWEILTAGTVEIEHRGARRKVNRFVLGNSAERAVVYYWYQGRGRVEADEYLVKWNLLRDAALTGRTEEALARIVVPVVEPTVAASGAMDRAYAAADGLAMVMARQVMDGLTSVLPSSATVLTQ